MMIDSEIEKTVKKYFPNLKGESLNIVIKHSSYLKSNKEEKFMFPEGIMIDPVSRQYRTCKIQSLFSYIVDLTKDTEGQKKTHR